MNRLDHKPREPHASIRMDARLDTMTRQKVDDLAKRFHQPRVTVVSHIMHWAISRGPMEKIDQGDTDGPIRHLHLHVDSELHEQVKKAATAAGVIPHLPAVKAASAPHRRMLGIALLPTRLKAISPHTPASLASTTCQADDSIPKTKPERRYATEGEAQKDGCRRSKR